jgi:hypothetical protein
MIFRKYIKKIQHDVRGSAHHRTIHKEKSKQGATMHQNFIIPYLYEAQHVLGL